jgi:hypothetical protein
MMSRPVVLSANGRNGSDLQVDTEAEQNRQLVVRIPRLLQPIRLSLLSQY